MAKRSWVAAAIVLGVGAARCLYPYVDPLTGGGTGPSDASVDAPKEAAAEGGTDGGSGRYCASLLPAPGFCDDFDDQGSFVPKWDSVYTRAGGSVARDGTDFRSSPNSLLTISPPANGPSSATLNHASVGSKGKVRVAYDIKVEARDTKSVYAEIDYIHFDGPGFSFATYFRLNTDANNATQLAAEAYLADGGIPAHNLTLPAARFDKWTRVAISIDVVSTPHVLSVSIDGVAAGSQVLEPNMYGPGPVTVSPGIGFTASPSATDWRIRYDNLTIDWE